MDQMKEDQEVKPENGNVVEENSVEKPEAGSGPAVKRLRINEQAEFFTTNDGDVKGDEDDGNEEEQEEYCSLCMEVGTDECPILEDHQCPQCAPGAWKICQVCNEALLSRTCPVCRGEYAPILMYPMPGLPLSSLASQSLSDEERTNLLYKFGIVRHLISKSNVAIWTPATKRMHFSLPQKISSGPIEEQSYALVSIACEEERVNGETFAFTNKVWDEIENEIESGEVTVGEIVEQQAAIQAMLAVTKNPGHILFTMLSPDDWQYMLDPSESMDTTEALKAIRTTIFRPVLTQFKTNEEKK